ncbi:MAG TPA: flagellar hook protein FlgE [Acidobacteriaceae bacterium]|nr:flagellar hook protein FlgE [Acidobacteriaceae bacterium]
MASFSVPLSGLQASSSGLQVIGNNLANLNTDGFKNQTLSFGDIFSQMQGTSGNGDPIQIGSGVQIVGTSSDLTNGSVNSTGTASNMALQGNGYFVVSKNGETSFTRNGDFSVNSSGQLTTADGDLVMGFPATNGTVSTTGVLAPITVNSNGTVPAAATSSFEVSANLNSASTVGTTFNTPIAIYDSLGTAQSLNIQYTNTGTNAWSYSVTLPGSATGSAAATTTLASGTMTFNSSGQLTSPTGAVAAINVTGLADGAANMSLTWNLADASGNPTITQQNTASALNTTPTQNGFAAGALTGYSVLSDGIVQGQYSNGQTLALGQVAVASFANPQGLAQTGDGNEQATSGSGAAVIGQAGVGGDGTITGGSVEGSNVSLSTEFANMIVAQQSYDANAKVLTTLNQVDQSTIQMVS